MSSLSRGHRSFSGWESLVAVVEVVGRSCPRSVVVLSAVNLPFLVDCANAYRVIALLQDLVTLVIALAVNMRHAARDGSLCCWGVAWVWLGCGFKC